MVTQGCVLLFCCTQETTNPRDASAEMCTAQPCIVVRGLMESPKDAFLVVEKKPLCKVPLQQLPLALIAAFYSFNMHYPQGCTNFYTFFEWLVLGKKVPNKRTRLSSVLARIDNFEL